MSHALHVRRCHVCGGITESAEDILSTHEIRVRGPQSGKVSVEESWFPEGTKNIGITSGASTPDIILFEIIQKISSLRT